MAKKFRNFDTFVQEKRKESLEFKLFGKTHTLPPTLRYDAVLELQRLAKRDKSDEVSTDEAFAVFELFIGTETLAELRLNPEFTVEVAAELTKWILEEYGLTQKTEENGGPKVQE